MPRPALLLFLLVFSGCLPHACSRSDSRALLPSDSLSRAIAVDVPETPLAFLGQTDLEPVLEHPRTLLYSPSHEGVFIADTRTDRLAFIGADGELREMDVELDSEHPYLSGLRGDTLAVLHPTALRIDFLTDAGRARSVAVDAERSESALSYAVVGDGAIYLKIVKEDDESRILRVNEDGRVTAEHPLPGPHWRHAGLLRLWGDTLVSLSGYRPVIDIVTAAGVVDTLALHGFDSPMLSRSRQFMMGDVADPPLLTSSAAISGDRLFVLNLRAGWIQIDVYDRAGRLQHILVEPDPQPGRRFYPVDLAVSPADAGLFDLYVLLVQPAARLLHFRADLSAEGADAAVS